MPVMTNFKGAFMNIEFAGRQSVTEPSFLPELQFNGSASSGLRHPIPFFQTPGISNPHRLLHSFRGYFQTEC